MGGPALVGREPQLQRLSRVLDETTAGIGRLVLISGEPGVGKTRLALELLDEASRRGARSLVGACWDGAGSPGLWPWVQVLRTLRADLRPDRWAALAALGLDALTRLLSSEDGEAPAEFHLFDSILQLLSWLCDDGPVVVLIDDLQWADASSVALIDFLHRHAVHLPLLVVGTYRDDELHQPDHPHRLRLADLAQKALTVPLTGLDNDGIRQLRDDLGVATTTAEAEHLRRLTGGNPFFVIESVAFSDPAESLGVRRAIDRRIDALAAADRSAMTVASLVGREAPDAVIDAVLGGGVSFAAIERSGLMVAVDGGHGFVHDLVRESLRDRLSTAERRSLSARIADAASSSSLAGCLLPSQVAFLATQAVPELPAERAVALLVEAAIDAAARLTHEAAGRHYEEAAALSASGDERSRWTLESAHSYQRAGALALARARYSSLVSVDDVSVRARALLGLHQLGDQAAVGTPSELVRQLDAVDVALQQDGGPSGLRAEVLAARSRSQTHALADDRSEAPSMAAEALDLARSAGDESTLASCLLAYHDAIWAPGTESARRSIADELATMGHRDGDASREAQGLLLRLVAEIELADPAWRATHARFDAVSEASASPRLRFVAASRRGMVAVLRASLAEAVAEIDAARLLGERIGDPDTIGMWCDQRWEVARRRGDAETIADLVTTLRGGGDPHWMVYDSLAAADAGDTSRVRGLMADVVALGERWPRWAARLWDTFLVELSMLDRDEGRIEALVARLTPDAEHWAVLGGGVLVHGPMSVWLGRLEAARSRWAAALEWSSVAESAAAAMGAELWVLEARTDRLVALSALGSVSTSEVASTRSLALAHELAPLVARLDGLAAAAPLPTSSSGPSVFRRDRDVWTLAFDGVEVRMPDSKGLRDLWVLLSNPGVEVAAVELASGGGGGGGAAAFASSIAAPVLDARAKQQYRARLDELDAALDRASLRGDAASASALEVERQALLDELRRAAGLGGRDRALGDDRERLRKTVTARIRDTLRRLDDRHPALAAHLRSSVRTGAFCVYAPPTPSPVRWTVG